ncbi:HAD-IA family hydrolase [Granulicella sp. WH15]|uniref:HAD-IA family hydrolase n=1 Tax=Granulicella sp. WH15 TaxID=2602070 RepID=UPI0013668BF1|nr:HAD-IA family hydrolase [Granulicella sp. WH15]QHN05015.1 HAD-IA family hydrolase [Granulicella sp. WH15]
MKLAAKGILFDMDGVLISSIASVNRCWRRWAQHYGIEGWETYTIPHGVRALDVMRSLRPDFTAEDEAVGLRLIEDMEIADIADLKVLPGVRALLESLPAERWAIVTSATRRLMLGRLTAAELPIPGRIIAGDDVVKGKPNPEPYMKGAALLGFAPAECIVVEDAPSGVGAGVAAGSRVLGVLGTHEKDELYAAGAEWVARSLEDVTASIGPDGLIVELAGLA